MKSQNNKDVKKGIVLFSCYLVASVFLAICIFSAFMKTSSVEVYKILAKTAEYDKTHNKQVHLTEKVDSIHFYTKQLNLVSSVEHMNINMLLSNKRFSLSDETNLLPEKDVKLYRKLAKDMPVFFSMKDSIRKMTAEEDRFRQELVRCLTESRNVQRRNSFIRPSSIR